MAKGGYRPNAGRKRSTECIAADVRAATEDLKAPGKFADAREFLMHLINRDDVDLRVKMNAASIVIPYQCAKVGEETKGKKEAKKEAAQKAGSDSDWGDDLKPGLRVVK